MKDGFLRVAAATPRIQIGNCHHNGAEIERQIAFAARGGTRLIVFSELCLTGASCMDLFFQDNLIAGALAETHRLAQATRQFDILSVVGLPLRIGASLYNAAAVLHRGNILGIALQDPAPKSPSARYFSPVPDESIEASLLEGVPIGAHLLFECETMASFKFAVEIGARHAEPLPPAALLATSGATLIANPSADGEYAGRPAQRKNLIQGRSARFACTYVAAHAGAGESSTDEVFSGHHLVVENGSLLAERLPFEEIPEGVLSADVDLGLIAHQRMRQGYESPCTCRITRVRFELPCTELDLARAVDPTPFVPLGKTERATHCDETLVVLRAALAQRLISARLEKTVIGISGGLDSTLALLATVQAFDELGLPRGGITTITMPCFGTTGRTHANAQKLASCLRTNLREVDICASVRQHFKDIGQDAARTDAAYENAQARERTQVLMDVANQLGALVVGTGDLSEAALGWTTYNGDHMSMYGLNASIPKTLVRAIVRHVAEQTRDATLAAVLADILETPVSPELLPSSQVGQSGHKTEEIVGPYELHDFFLYHAVQNGFSPDKIHRIAQIAWGRHYTSSEIKKWLRLFYRRFFSQQFKRSCSPDGPKATAISLSPRGAWLMPSDADSAPWLDNPGSTDETDKTDKNIEK